MTKTKLLLLICLALSIAVFSGCRNNDNYSESEPQNSKIVVTTAESTTEEKTVTETTTEKEKISETTTKTSQKDKADQTTTKPKKQTATHKQTITQKQTVTQKQTTTQKQTVTNKPTTTKKQSTTKEKTTAATTAKRNKLTQSDVDWVQSQAHSYIRSKGCNVNSSASSFSGRISTKNFTDKNSLLSEVKEWIDSEYDDCIASGWKTVDMYCKIESRSDGNYFIYVMYG